MSSISAPPRRNVQAQEQPPGPIRGHPSLPILPSPTSHPDNPIVFLDFEIAPPSNPRFRAQAQQSAGQQPQGSIRGRVRIQLFSHVLPQTCENFRRFCVGEPSARLRLVARTSVAKVQGAAGLGATMVGYKGCIVHRVVRNFMVQTGDFVNANGTGCASIYKSGGSFPDEGFLFPHDRPGLLSMANSGPDTNGCQFFITAGDPGRGASEVRTRDGSGGAGPGVGAHAHLDGKHVVFGRVLDPDEDVHSKTGRSVRRTAAAATGVPEKEAPVGGDGTVLESAGWMWDQHLVHMIAGVATDGADKPIGKVTIIESGQLR